MIEQLLELAAKHDDPIGRMNVAREYLQASAMRSLHESEAFACLSFVGGTALRFLHGLRRFSEDLDFSLESPAAYEPKLWLAKMKRDFEYAGFKTDIAWNDRKTVQTAWLRVEGLLKDLGLSSLKGQKLAIKLEIDTQPPLGACLESSLVNRYLLFAVRHHDLPSLMAGKIRALLTRGFTKGRDWYDLVWYLAKIPPVEPNSQFLINALAQQPALLPSKLGFTWKAALTEKLQSLDWAALTADVEPFLEQPGDIALLERSAVERLLR